MRQRDKGLTLVCTLLSFLVPCCEVLMSNESGEAFGCLNNDMAIRDLSKQPCANLNLNLPMLIIYTLSAGLLSFT